MTQRRSWTLRLPFMSLADAPSLNSRGSHYARAAKVKAWRNAAYWLARAERIPACERIRVGLVYTPKVSRRRDPDNLVGLLKPCVDGLVDAGVVPDDTAEQVARRWPVFAAPCKEVPGGSRFLLVVERLA